MLSIQISNPNFASGSVGEISAEISVVRIDFIYDEVAEKAFMLEVNTVPGQSEASVIPQQVKAMGWNLTDFYGWIIEDSLEQK